MRLTVKHEAGIAGIILLATIALTIAVPDAPSQVVSSNSAFIAAIALLIVLFGAKIYLHPKSAQSTADVFLIIAVVLLLWEVLLGKLALLDPFIFPGPTRVFRVFEIDWQQMLAGVISSLEILSVGYAIALVAAIPVGLYIGWRKRLFDAAYPIAKAVSPIPPTVYLPYAIVLLPTFAASSVFLIFIGAFWPILVGSVYGVFSIDPRLINSARTLDLPESRMIRRILLPAAMPTIFSGAMIALIMSFITLTVAEMIAATSGLGWYIQYHHQFANYDNVIAGMILITVVVVAVMYLFDRIQAHSLRWQNAE
ncbi:MAG: ABC transporter permease subunit [Methanoculleus sp.]|jgi:NitT/TauT family transport system permease protein|uniref:ABC transporter permease n=1 Tax=Methanoculleus sp. TaxID=90427 RepID=UPI00261A41B5|nr:ABC transporter permease subunit [Methanoculleus sp.]MCK9305936.1 ABC transporter permease subunit [Methanoculleus sp.]MDD2254307.1 ABC transporter permease subunit [Methanoculleus sp.]MDD4314781.1 ABC transporter permease subunit [Methanoculleus sp.]MDD4471157.1 ABC transporter permease subunit [Methanoculleus sp.]